MSLSDLFNAFLDEQRKKQDAIEKDRKNKEWGQKQKENREMEKEIIKAMQDKDFPKAIYLDKKIKENNGGKNEQKDN